MRHQPLFRSLAASLLMVMFNFIVRNQVGVHPAQALGARASGSAAQSYGALPLSFIANAGQTDRAIRFEVRDSGGSLTFANDGVTLALVPPVPTTNPALPGRDGQNAVRDTAVPQRLRLTFAHANPTVSLTGADPLPGLANFFIGSDPAQWHTNIPTYAGVVYHNLYPGVDLTYGGSDNVFVSKLDMIAIPPPTSTPTKSTVPPTPNVSVADPVITKTGNPALARPGDTVVFTLTVTNSGSAPAVNVIVTDPLPSQLVYISATAIQGTFTATSNMVLFTLGTVNPGQVLTLTLTTRIAGSVVPPATIVNTATLVDDLGHTSSSSATIHITAGNLPGTGEHPTDENGTPSIPWFGVVALLILVGAFAVRMIGQRRG